MRISLGEKTTKPDKTDDEGFIRWSVDLAPKEKKKVFFSYTIEYPKSYKISGL